MNFLKVLWRWVRWPLAILLILYIGAVIWRAAFLIEEGETAKVVEQIHADRLTMNDVDGKHLPPPPDKALNDSTIEGIDANANGIRDDVELAIFEKYPDDIKLRAAVLQYAKAQLKFISDVVNKDTWKAVAEEAGRANLCLIELRLGYANLRSISDEVEGLIFNTPLRKAARDSAFKFTATHGDAEGASCDVAL